MVDPAYLAPAAHPLQTPHPRRMTSPLSHFLVFFSSRCRFTFSRPGLLVHATYAARNGSWWWWALLLKNLPCTTTAGPTRAARWWVLHGGGGSGLPVPMPPLLPAAAGSCTSARTASVPYTHLSFNWLARIAVPSAVKDGVRHDPLCLGEAKLHGRRLRSLAHLPLLFSSTTYKHDGAFI
jgi:hypothetical protein